MGVFLSIFQTAVLPELMRYIRDHYTRTGQMPTDADIIAELHSNTTIGIAIGKAFLESHE